MKYTRTQDRLGLTAIAAVLALSPTPLAAQEATSPATTTETQAPTPADPAVDPLAPAPTPEVSAPSETTATTTEATEAVPAAKTATKPVAKKSVKKATNTAPKAATSANSTASAAPVPSAEPMVQATPPATPVAAAEPAPAETAPVAAQTAEKPKIEEALPVAGGAGAVILALAGAGMAVRRRRRREEDELELDRQAYAENTDAAWEPIADEEPAPAWSEPVMESKPVVAPAAMQPTGISDDFDTSGFGRHVKAAYEGPTPENSSLSLRKRLKIAGELDRREKASGIAPKPVDAAVKHVSIPAPMPSGEKSAMSFSGTAKQKWPEYQL